jgi:hypothetical protein
VPKKETGVCWDNGCQQINPFEHRDVCKFKKKPVLRQMAIEEIDVDDDVSNMSYDDESPIFCMLVENQKSTAFICTCQT